MENSLVGRPAGNRRITLYALALAFVLIKGWPAAHASAISEIFSINDWQGAAYLNESGGAFSHCSIYAEYPSGSTLYFSLDSARNLAIALTNKDWSLDPSEIRKITLAIDIKTRLTLPGRWEQDSMLIIDLGATRSTAIALAGSKKLVISTERDDFAFDLRGMSSAFGQLNSCVDLHKNNSGNPLLAFVRPSQNPDKRNGPASLSLRDVVTMLDRSGLRYRFERPAENSRKMTDLFDFSWETDEEVLGSLTQLSSEHASPEAVTSAFIADLNQNCRGDFVLGSRPADPALGGVVRRAISSCSEKDTIIRMFYTIITSHGTVAVILSYAANPERATQVDEEIFSTIQSMLLPESKLH